MQSIEQVLNNHWDWYLPVKIEDIANALSINLLKLPKDVHSQGDISGMSTLGDNGDCVVYYNDNESLNRQRFAIAHGVGHHMLGHIVSKSTCLIENGCTFNSKNKDEREASANQFAIQLLMPTDAVKTLLFAKGISDIGELAKRFSVSEAAMYYRLKCMGYLTL